MDKKQTEKSKKKTTSKKTKKTTEKPVKKVVKKVVEKPVENEEIDDNKFYKFISNGKHRLLKDGAEFSIKGSTLKTFLKLNYGRKG
jgi:hypothetical protein